MSAVVGIPASAPNPATGSCQKKFLENQGAIQKYVFIWSVTIKQLLEKVEIASRKKEKKGDDTISHPQLLLDSPCHLHIKGSFPTPTKNQKASQHFLTLL